MFDKFRRQPAEASREASEPRLIGEIFEEGNIGPGKPLVSGKTLEEGELSPASKEARAKNVGTMILALQESRSVATDKEKEEIDRQLAEYHQERVELDVQDGVFEPDK